MLGPSIFVGLMGSRTAEKVLVRPCIFNKCRGGARWAANRSFLVANLHNKRSSVGVLFAILRDAVVTVLAARAEPLIESLPWAERVLCPASLAIRRTRAASTEKSLFIFQGSRA